MKEDTNQGAITKPAAAKTATAAGSASQPAATNTRPPSPAGSPIAGSPRQQSLVAIHGSHGGFSQCFQECMDTAGLEAACLPPPHSPVLLSRSASPAGAGDSCPGIISASFWLAGDGQQQQQQQDLAATASRPGSCVGSWAGSADGWGGPVFAPRAPASPILSTDWVTQPTPDHHHHQHQYQHQQHQHQQHQRHPSPFSSASSTHSTCSLSPTPSYGRLAPSAVATAHRAVSPCHSPNAAAGIQMRGSLIEVAAVAAADRLWADHGSPAGSSRLATFSADNELQQQLQLMQLSAGNTPLQQQQQHMLAGSSWQQQQQQPQMMRQFSSSPSSHQLPGRGSISCNLAVPRSMPPSASQLQQEAAAVDDAAIAAVDMELLQLLQLRQQLVESRLAPGLASSASASASPRHTFAGTVLPASSHQDMQALQAASWTGAGPLFATDGGARSLASTSPATSTGMAMADFVAQHSVAQQRHRACMSALEAQALQGSSGGAAVQGGAGSSSLSTGARSKLQELLVIQQLQLNLQDELLMLCSNN